MDAALYRIGKGKKIAARRVDQVVIDRLMADPQSDEIVERVTSSVRNLIDEPADGRKIAGLEKKLVSLTGKIGKLVDLLADATGPVADAYKRSISQAEAERAAQVDALWPPCAAAPSNTKPPSRSRQTTCASSCVCCRTI